MARAKKSTSIPTEKSLLFRAMRPLLDDGSPVGPLTLLGIKSGRECGAYPFFALALTKKGRLVAWPVLPNVKGMFDIDHITLELSNGRLHRTCFNANGEREATTVGWRVQEFPSANVDLCLNFIIRSAVIEAQELVIERWMKSPTPEDAERRKLEFVRFAQNLRVVDVNAPPAEGDYLIGSFLLHRDPSTAPNVIPEWLFASKVDNEIDGWLNGTFAVGVTKAQVGAVNLLVAVARPPGRARSDVVIGFPRFPE